MSVYEDELYDDNDKVELDGSQSTQGTGGTTGTTATSGSSITSDSPLSLGSSVTTRTVNASPTAADISTNYVTPSTQSEDDAKAQAELDLATGVDHVLDDTDFEEYISIKELYEKNLGVTKYDELRAALHLEDDESFTEYYERTGYIPKGFELDAQLLLAEERRKKLYAEHEAGNMSEATFLYEAYGKDLLKQQGIDFSSSLYWYQQYKKDKTFQDPRKNNLFMAELIKSARAMFQEESWVKEAQTQNILDMASCVTGQVLDAKTVAELFPQFFGDVSEGYENVSKLIKYYRGGLLQGFDPTIDADGDGKVDYYYAPDGKLYNVNETGEGANTFKAYYNKEDDGSYIMVDRDGDGIKESYSLNRIVRADSYAGELGSELLRGIGGFFTGILDLGALAIGFIHDIVDGGEFGNTMADYQANVTSWVNSIPILGEQDYIADTGFENDAGDFNHAYVWRSAANFIGYIIPTVVIAICTGGGSLAADAAEEGVKAGAKAGATAAAGQAGKAVAAKTAKKVAKETAEDVISNTVVKRTVGQAVKGFAKGVAKKAGQTALALTKYQYGFGATGWAARASSALVVAVKDTLYTTAALKINQERLGLSDGEIIGKSLAFGGIELISGILLRSVGDESALKSWSKIAENSLTKKSLTSNNPMVRGFFQRLATNSMTVGDKVGYAISNVLMDGLDNALSAGMQASLLQTGDLGNAEAWKEALSNPQFVMNIVYQSYQNTKDTVRISRQQIMENTVDSLQIDTTIRTAFNTAIEEIESRPNKSAADIKAVEDLRVALREYDMDIKNGTSKTNAEIQEVINKAKQKLTKGLSEADAKAVMEGTLPKDLDPKLKTKIEKIITNEEKVPTYTKAEAILMAAANLLDNKLKVDTDSPIYKELRTALNKNVNSFVIQRNQHLFEHLSRNSAKYGLLATNIIGKMGARFLYTKEARDLQLNLARNIYSYYYAKGDQEIFKDMIYADPTEQLLYDLEQRDAVYRELINRLAPNQAALNKVTGYIKAESLTTAIKLKTNSDGKYIINDAGVPEYEVVSKLNDLDDNQRAQLNAIIKSAHDNEKVDIDKWCLIDLKQTGDTSNGDEDFISAQKYMRAAASFWRTVLGEDSIIQDLGNDQYIIKYQGLGYTLQELSHIGEFIQATTNLKLSLSGEQDFQTVKSALEALLISTGSVEKKTDIDTIIVDSLDMLPDLLEELARTNRFSVKDITSILGYIESVVDDYNAGRQIKAAHLPDGKGYDSYGKAVKLLPFLKEWDDIADILSKRNPNKDLTQGELNKINGFIRKYAKMSNDGKYNFSEVVTIAEDEKILGKNHLNAIKTLRDFIYGKVDNSIESLKIRKKGSETSTSISVEEFQNYLAKRFSPETLKLSRELPESGKTQKVVIKDIGTDGDFKRYLASQKLSPDDIDIEEQRDNYVRATVKMLKSEFAQVDVYPIDNLIATAINPDTDKTDRAWARQKIQEFIDSHFDTTDMLKVDLDNVKAFFDTQEELDNHSNMVYVDLNILSSATGAKIKRLLDKDPTKRAALSKATSLKDVTNILLSTPEDVNDFRKSVNTIEALKNKYEGATYLALPMESKLFKDLMDSLGYHAGVVTQLTNGELYVPGIYFNSSTSGIKISDGDSAYRIKLTLQDLIDNEQTSLLKQEIKFKNPIDTLVDTVGRTVLIEDDVKLEVDDIILNSIVSLEDFELITQENIDVIATQIKQGKNAGALFKYLLTSAKGSAVRGRSDSELEKAINTYKVIKAFADAFDKKSSMAAQIITVDQYKKLKSTYGSSGTFSFVKLDNNTYEVVLTGTKETFLKHAFKALSGDTEVKGLEYLIPLNLSDKPHNIVTKMEKTNISSAYSTMSWLEDKLGNQMDVNTFVRDYSYDHLNLKGIDISTETYDAAVKALNGLTKAEAISNLSTSKNIFIQMQLQAYKASTIIGNALKERLASRIDTTKISIDEVARILADRNNSRNLGAAILKALENTKDSLALKSGYVEVTDEFAQEVLNNLDFTLKIRPSSAQAEFNSDTSTITGSQLATLNAKGYQVDIQLEGLKEILKLIPLEYSVLTGKAYYTDKTKLLAMIESASHCSDGSLAISTKDLYALNSEDFELLKSIVDEPIKKKIDKVQKELIKSTYYKSRTEERELEKRLQNTLAGTPSKASSTGDITDTFDVDSLPQSVIDEINRLIYNANLSKDTEQFVKLSQVMDNRFEYSYEMKNIADQLGLNVLPYTDHEGSLMLQNLNIAENLYYFYHNITDFANSLVADYGLSKEASMNLAFEYYLYSVGMQSQAAHPDILFFDTKQNKVVDIAISGSKSDVNAGFIARLYNNYFETKESGGIKFKDSFTHRFKQDSEDSVVNPKDLIAIRLNTNVLGTTFNKAEVDVDIYDIGNNEQKFINIFKDKIHSLAIANGLTPEIDNYNDRVTTLANDYFYKTEYATKIGKNRQIINEGKDIFYKGDSSALVGTIEQYNPMDSSLTEGENSFRHSLDIEYSRSEYNRKERDINDMAHYGVSQNTLRDTDGLDIYMSEQSRLSKDFISTKYLENIEELKLKEQELSNSLDPMLEDIEKLKAKVSIEDSEENNLFKELKIYKDKKKQLQQKFDSIHKELTQVKQDIKDLHALIEGENPEVEIGTEEYSDNAYIMREELIPKREDLKATLTNLHEQYDENNLYIDIIVSDIEDLVLDHIASDELKYSFAKYKEVVKEIKAIKEQTKQAISDSRKYRETISDVIDLYKDNRYEVAENTVKDLIKDSNIDTVTRQLITELVRQDNSVEGTLFKLSGYNLNAFSQRSYETKIQVGDRYIPIKNLLSEPYVIIDAEVLYNNKKGKERSHVYEVSIIFFDGVEEKKATKYIPYIDKGVEIKDIKTLRTLFEDFFTEYYDNYTGSKKSIDNLINNNSSKDFDDLLLKANELNATMLGFNSKQFDIPKLLDSGILSEDLHTKLLANHVDLFDIVQDPINNLNLYGGKATLTAVVEQLYKNAGLEIPDLLNSHIADADNNLVIEALKQIIKLNEITYTSDLYKDITELYKNITGVKTIGQKEYNKLNRIFKLLNTSTNIEKLETDDIKALKAHTNKILEDKEYYSKAAKVIGLITEKDIIGKTNVLIKHVNKVLREAVGRDVDFADSFYSNKAKSDLITAIAYKLKDINTEGNSSLGVQTAIDKKLSSIAYEISNGTKNGIIEGLISNSSDIFKAFNIDTNSEDFKAWRNTDGANPIDKVYKAIDSAYGPQFNYEYKQKDTISSVGYGLKHTHDYIDKFSFLPNEIKELMHNMSDNLFDYKGDYKDLSTEIHLDAFSKQDKLTMDWFLTDPVMTSTQVGIYRKATSTSEPITLLRTDEKGNKIITRPKNMVMYVTEKNYRDLLGIGENIHIDPNEDVYIPVIRYPADKLDSIHYVKLELMEDSNLEVAVTPDTMLLLNGDLDGDNTKFARPDKLQSSYAASLFKNKRYSEYETLSNIMEEVMNSNKRDRTKNVQSTKEFFKLSRDNDIATHINNDLDKLYTGKASYKQLKERFIKAWSGKYSEKILNSIYITEATDVSGMLSNRQVIYKSDFCHPLVLQNATNKKARTALMFANATMFDIIALNDQLSGMFQKSLLDADYSVFEDNGFIEASIRLSDTTRLFLDELPLKEFLKIVDKNIDKAYKYEKILNSDTMKNSEKLASILQLQQLSKVRSEDYKTNINQSVIKLKESSKKDPKASKFISAFDSFTSGTFEGRDFFRTIDEIVNIKKDLLGNRFTFGKSDDFLNLLYQIMPKYAPAEVNENYKPGKEGYIIHLFNEDIDNPEDTMQWVGWNDKKGKAMGANEWHYIDSGTTKLLSPEESNIADTYSRGDAISKEDVKAFGINYHPDGQYFFIEKVNNKVVYLIGFNIDTSKIMIDGNINTKATPTKTITDLNDLPEHLKYLTGVFEKYNAKGIVKESLAAKKTEKFTDRYKNKNLTLIDATGKETKNLDDAVGYITKERVQVLENTLKNKSEASEIKLEESAIGNNLLSTGGAGLTYGVFYNDKNGTLEFDSSKYSNIKRLISSLNSADRYSTDAQDLYEHLVIATIIDHMSASELDNMSREEAFIKYINGDRYEFINRHLPKYQNVEGKAGKLLSVDLKNKIYGIKNTGVDSTNLVSTSSHIRGLDNIGETYEQAKKIKGQNTSLHPMVNNPNVTTAELHNLIRVNKDGYLSPAAIKRAEQYGLLLNKKIEGLDSDFTFHNNNNPKTGQNLGQRVYTPTSLSIMNNDIDLDNNKTSYTNNYKFETKGQRSIGYTRSPISERSKALNNGADYMAGSHLAHLINSLRGLDSTYKSRDKIIQTLNPDVDVYQSISMNDINFGKNGKIQKREMRIDLTPEGFRKTSIDKARENIYRQRSSPLYWAGLNKYSEDSITRPVIDSPESLSISKDSKNLDNQDLNNIEVANALDTLTTKTPSMQKYMEAAKAFTKELADNNVVTNTDNYHGFIKGDLVGNKVFQESKIGLNQGLKHKDADHIIQDRNIRQMAVDEQNMQRVFSNQLESIKSLVYDYNCEEEFRLYTYVIALNARANANDSTHPFTKQDATSELARLNITDSTQFIKDFSDSYPKLAKKFNSMLLNLDAVSQKYSQETNEPTMNIYKLLTPSVRNSRTARKNKVRGIQEWFRSGPVTMVTMDQDTEPIVPYDAYDVIGSLDETISAVSKRAAIVSNAERLKKNGVIDSVSIQHILEKAFSDPAITKLFTDPDYTYRTKSETARQALLPVIRRLTDRFGNDEEFMTALGIIDHSLTSDNKDFNIGKTVLDTFGALSKKISSYKISLDDALELANQKVPGAEDVIYAYKQLQDLYANLVYINKDACKQISDKINTYCKSKNLAIVDKYGRKFDPDFMYAMNNTSLEYLPKALEIALSKKTFGYDQFIVMQVLSGNAFLMDDNLANTFAKRVFVTKPLNGIQKILQKTSSWCTKMLMSSPFKYIDRLFKFSLFDTATLSTANHNTLFKQGEAFRDLRAYFSTKGAVASDNLAEFMNTQGISFNDRDFDNMMLGGTQTKTKLFKSYTDKVSQGFTFQTLSQRYAYWLATKDALDKGNYSVLGSAYHLRDKLETADMTSGEKASFAMAQMLGSSNDFPAISKDLNRYGFVFTTFPLAATRYGIGQLKSAGAAIHDLFTEGCKLDGAKWLARNTSGIITTIMLERLMVSVLASMYGIDEDDEDVEEWKNLGALPNITQTLIQGQPIMDTFSSMNPSREVLNLFINTSEPGNEEQTINGLTRFIRKNIISHINPLVKNTIEVATGKDWIDDQLIDTKNKYNAFENVFRKTSSYFIGAAGANALVNTFGENSLDNLPATLGIAARNVINAELGNTKTFKENRKNYYNSIKLINEYIYDDSTTQLSSFDDFNNYNSNDFNQARYNTAKKKIYALINAEAPISDVYATIEDLLNSGSTYSEIKSALKNCSVSGKLSSMADYQDFIDSLSEKELQNIKTALTYENYIFPWLGEGVSYMTNKIKESKQREYNSFNNSDTNLYIPSYYKPNNYTQQYNYSNYSIPRSYNNYKSNYSNPFNTYSTYLKNLRYQQQQAEYARKRKQWEDN